MTCNKKSLSWKRAMAIARREYPRMGLSRRKKVAGAIIGGRKKKT